MSTTTTPPGDPVLPDLTALTEAVQQLERRGEQVLLQMQRRTRQLWVVVLTIALGVAAVAFYAVNQAGEQGRIKAGVEQQTSSDCPFYAKVAAIPFTAKTGVELGRSARDTYNQRGCAARYGPLPVELTPAATD